MSSAVIHEPLKSHDDDPEFQAHERFSFEPSEPDTPAYMNGANTDDDDFEDDDEYSGDSDDPDFDEYATDDEADGGAQESSDQAAGAFPARKSSLRRPGPPKPRLSTIPPPPRVPSAILANPDSPTTPTSAVTIGPDTVEFPKTLQPDPPHSLPASSSSGSESDKTPFPDLETSESRPQTAKPRNVVDTTVPHIGNHTDLLDSPASPSADVIYAPHSEPPPSDLASSPTSPTSPVNSIFSSIKNNGSETQSSDYSRPDTELMADSSELSKKLEADTALFDAPEPSPPPASSTSPPKSVTSSPAMDNSPAPTPPLLGASPTIQQSPAATPPLTRTSPIIQQSPVAESQTSTPVPSIPSSRASKSSLRSFTSADERSGIPPVPPLPSNETSKSTKPPPISVVPSGIPPVPPLPPMSPTFAGKISRPGSQASSHTSGGTSEYGEPTKTFVVANRSKSLKIQPARYRGRKSIHNPNGPPSIVSPIGSPKISNESPLGISSLPTSPMEGVAIGGTRSRAVSDGAGLVRPPLRSAVSTPGFNTQAADLPRAPTPPLVTEPVPVIDSTDVSEKEPTPGTADAIRANIRRSMLAPAEKEPTPGTAAAIRASIRRSMMASAEKDSTPDSTDATRTSLRRSVLTTASSGVGASSTERSSQYTYRSSTSEIATADLPAKAEHWPMITEEDVLTPEEEAMITSADQVRDDDEMSVEDAIMMYMNGFDSDDEEAKQVPPLPVTREIAQPMLDEPPTRPPRPEIRLDDTPEENEDSDEHAEPLPPPKPQPARPEVQIPKMQQQSKIELLSKPTVQPEIQLQPEPEGPATFLSPPSPNPSALSPPKQSHRRTSTQLIAGELGLDSSPRQSPTQSPQQRQAPGEESATLRALTQPNDGSPIRGRDRYGFKTENQWVSAEEYALWNKGYTYYLQNRKKKWIHFMNHYGLKSRGPTEFPPRSDKLKRYIRKGIPPEWRGAAWFYYGGGHEELAKNPGLYSQLLQRIASGEGKESDHDLIERDLHRTFPDNIRFKNDSQTSSSPSNASPSSPTPETSMIQSLRRVLRAFALQNLRIGYCQSLNFLAGTLLLFLDGNEEKAFHLLNVLTNVHLPGTHGIALEGANVDIGVLMSALKESLPAVWAKLDDRADSSRAVAASDMRVAAGLPTVSLATTAWFMSAFVATLPIETAVRAWDVLFYEGSKTLFRIALAIFKLGEREIREKSDPIEVFQVVQTLPRRLIDANAVLDVAMRKGRQGIGSVSQEVVETRREERRELYKKEAEKVFRVPPPPPPPPPDGDEYNERALEHGANRLSRSSTKSSKLKRMVSLKRSATTASTATTSSASTLVENKEKDKEVMDKKLSRSSSRARVKRMMSKKVGLDSESKKVPAK